MWSCISSTLHYCPIFWHAFGLRLLYTEIHITCYALTSFWLSLWLKYYHFTIIHLPILHNFYSRWIYYFSVCNVMIFIPFLGEIICIASGAGIIYLLSPIHLKLFLLAFNILFCTLFHLMRFFTFKNSYSFVIIACDIPYFCLNLGIFWRNNYPINNYILVIGTITWK